MAEAARDENLVKSLLGVSDIDSLTPIRLAVDPSTKRLLIEINGVTTTSPATLPTSAPRDGNLVPALMGVTDDSNLTISPLIVDNRNGYPFVDILQE